MIQVKRTRMQKKIVLLIVLSALFVLLLGGYLIARALTPDVPDDPAPSPIVVDTELGEAVYNNSPVVYEPIGSESINDILIHYKTHPIGGEPEDYNTESYSFVKNSNNVMLLYVNDQLFAPQILDDDSNFDYTELYAIEENDGFGRIMKLTYLCVAIGSPYFSEKIALPTDTTERKSMLAQFGLTQSKATELWFDYGSDGEGGYAGTHYLAIGDSAVNGTGFYFLVDNRDFIYYTTSSYLAYADAPAASFIRPNLIAAGLPSDSAMEPYLTPDFHQYKNTLHEEGIVPENADLVARAVGSSPISQSTKVNSGISDSYQTVPEADYPISLSLSEKRKRYFSGKKVGQYPVPFYYTEATDSNIIDFGEKTSASYVYTIVAIEAAITDSEEIRTPGASIPDNAQLIVTYRATKDGVSLNEFTTILSDALTISLPLHAVIDLSDERIDPEVRSALRSASVGALETPVVLEKTYQTTDTDNLREISWSIREITYIIDSEGKATDTVTNGCSVSYSYYETVDGVASSVLFYDGIVIGGSEDELSVALSAALMGQKISNNLNINVPVYSCHTEYFMHFTTYEIREISYYTTYEEVVAFEFVNASDRDPYFGETFYKNTMGSAYSLYGLNTAACESVVKKLGGISNSQNASASSSAGLSGAETVKIGITPAVMKEYGLYAYTVFFDLPRGITTIELENDEDNAALSEYAFANVLHFVLYVSEKKFDTETESYYRYAASNLYDVVVKIDADEFLFLDYDFLSFYARRNLIMMYIDNVEAIDVDFLMDDLKGSYQMDVEHNIRYYRTEDGKLKTFTDKLYSLTDQNGNVKLFPSREDIEKELMRQLYTEEEAKRIAANCPAIPSYDFMNILVTPSYGDSSSAFTRYLDEKGYTAVNTAGETVYLPTTLHEFYRYAVNGGVTVMDSTGFDEVSVSYFKEIFNMIYSSFYAGQMSEEDLATLSSDDPIFRLTLSVKGQSDQYVYEFYRTSDRRVGVKLSKPAANASVASFYVSSFTAKRFIGAFYALLNGDGYESSVVYTD